MEGVKATTAGGTSPRTPMCARAAVDDGGIPATTGEAVCVPNGGGACAGTGGGTAGRAASTIDTRVKNLRRKIATHLGGREVIPTVYGVGYTFSLREE
jgi:hypothetical protein